MFEWFQVAHQLGPMFFLVWLAEIFFSSKIHKKMEEKQFGHATEATELHLSDAAFSQCLDVGSM